MSELSAASSAIRNRSLKTILHYYTSEKFGDGNT